jgi:hypothetical protein
MSNIRKLSAIVFAVVASLFFGSAHANVITGDLWRVAEAIASDASLANVPATTADVTFKVDSPLNFSATDATIGAWLTSGHAFNVVENTPDTLTALMDDNATGALLRFTGFVTVTNGQLITVTHDDGLTLIIDGIDLGFGPGPASSETSTRTYTGPSGTFAFELVYGECCRGAAVLQVDLPFSNAAPEPGTLGLLGASLIGLAMSRRRNAN